MPAPTADPLVSDPVATTESRREEPETLLFDQPTTETKSFATIEAFCADTVRTAHMWLDDENTKIRLKSEGIVATTPSCKRLPAAATLAPSRGYQRLETVRVSNGVWSHTTFLVKLARGLVATPVHWDAVDPLDPGCPSIVREETVEEVRVENAHIVFVMGGTRLEYLPPSADREKTGDSGARVALERVVTWCTDDGNAFSCREWNPQYQSSLGSKTQPAPVEAVDLQVPWSTLPWRNQRSFHITPDGTLRTQN